MKATIQNEINVYRNHIIDFIFALTQHYEIDIEDFNQDPYKYIGKIIPRDGDFTFGKIIYAFHFHGSGCDVKVNNDLLVYYNFAPLDTPNIKTTAWQFYNFLKSNYRDKSIAESEVEMLFEELSQEGKLLNKHPHGYFYLPIDSGR